MSDPLEIRPEVDELLDESDLSDATQARPEDGPTLSPRQLGEAAALERVTVWAVGDGADEDPDHLDQARPEDVAEWGASGMEPPGTFPEGVAVCSGEYPECSHAVDHSPKAPPDDASDGPPWYTPGLPMTVEPAGEASYDGPGWDKATRSIVSLAGLNWAGGVLREIRAAMAQNEEMAKGEIEALEHKLNVARLRLDRAQKPLRADAEFFERAISTYAQTHKAEILRGYGKRKSRRFPSGLTVAYRAVGGEYRWRQDMTPKEREEALLRWAQESADPGRWVRLEPMPNTDAIKAALMRSRTAGPVLTPPGLEWVESGESIKIQVGEEK